MQKEQSHSKSSIPFLSDPSSKNQALLVVFCITLLFIFSLHTFRLSRLLVIEQKNVKLAIFVAVKTVLLALDVATNGILLYVVLTFQGENLFRVQPLTFIVLSVIAASPAVTLTTNVLVNLPLHYFYLRMQLSKIQVILQDADGVKRQVDGADVAFSLVLKAALRKTFHPLITSIFGTYALYSVGCLGYTLFRLGYHLTSDSLRFPGFASYDLTSMLFGLLWANVACNYLVGVVTGIIYWLTRIGTLPATLCHGFAGREANKATSQVATSNNVNNCATPLNQRPNYAAESQRARCTA
jgi:hypothetical protein